MEISERKFPTNRQGSGLKPVHFPTLAEIMPDVRNMTSTLQFKMRIAGTLHVQLNYQLDYVTLYQNMVSGD